MSDDLSMRLLDEFARRRTAGELPDPVDYLERAGADRDELASLLDLYLADHPAPDPSPERLQALAVDPRLAVPGWPELLVEAREQDGLLRRTVVERLTSALGLGDAKRDRVGYHLHELETGQRDPRGVSERVIDALDGIFGGLGEMLRRARAVAAPPPPPAVGATPAFARDAAAAAPAPAYVEPGDPEVDALFEGGQSGSGR
jgi:hypothetical protein